jgi:sulfoquinovose isomerase
MVPAAAARRGALPAAPERLLADSVALFDAATARGWHVDGAEGFVYTLDWQDQPVVRERMHWVVAEALAAATVLARRTGEQRYDEWFVPSSTVWSGKPDVYHAYQAMLFPLARLARTLAGGLR